MSLWWKAAVICPRPLAWLPLRVMDHFPPFSLSLSSVKDRMLFCQGTCSLMMSLDLSVWDDVHDLLLWQMEFLVPNPLFPLLSQTQPPISIISYVLFSFLVWCVGGCMRACIWNMFVAYVAHASLKLGILWS